MNNANLSLPKYNDYTVDYRLSEFRLMDYEKGLAQFIPFRSPRGSEMLQDYEDNTCPECKCFPCQCYKKDAVKDV